MVRTTLALTLSLLAFSACKKKDGDKAAPAGDDKAAPAADKPAADKPAADKPAEPAAAGGAPVQTNPKDLYAEFTKPNADGMALLDKYNGGASFTGKVIVASKEEDGSPVIFFDIDGAHKMSVKFTDPASVKDVKIGDSLNVTCKIGGADEHIMMVIDCAKK